MGMSVEIHFFPKNFLVFKFSDVIRNPGLIVRGENAGLGPQCRGPWVAWFPRRAAGEQWGPAAFFLQQLLGLYAVDGFRGMWFCGAKEGAQGQ